MERCAPHAYLLGMTDRIEVKRTDLSPESALHDRIGADDFLDCFSAPSTLPAREAAEIIVEFPSWARFLLVIRRAVTAPFGLSNDGPKAKDKLGIFPVELDSEEEVIAGFNDKHLDFRVSVRSKDGEVSLATWVHPHNFAGRLYLAAILPFHIAIARNGVRRVAMHRA